MTSTQLDKLQPGDIVIATHTGGFYNDVVLQLIISASEVQYVRPARTLVFSVTDTCVLTEVYTARDSVSWTKLVGL